MQACSGSLKLCYWNIHGWSSKIIGNKLCDKEFLDKILNYDIVALAELHSEKKLSLPGFMNIDQKIRDKTHKGPKIAGGIAIFIKNEYESLIKVIPNKNPNSIWIKIEKEKCGETEDIFIGSFYISPGKQKNAEKDFYASFNEEIECFKQKGIVLIQGDLNARVGKELDYIEFDKHLDLGDIDGTGSSQEPREMDMTGEIVMDYPPRNSEDKKVNPRGRELLDICRVHDLLIANGRVTGDIFGKYTSHQYNGSALNDYLLVPNKFYQRISNFMVGDYSPWLSDHCPIYSNISLNSTMDSKTQMENHNDIDPSFIFDTNAKNKFSDGLKSMQMKGKINALIENNDLSAKTMGNSIKLVLIENAKKCKIKIRKKRRDDPQGAPWFDGKCENSKNKVRKFGNDLKKCPQNSEIRQQLQEAKRKLKQIVTNKKRGYRQGIIDKMAHSQKGNKEFWKLLKKLSDKQPKTSSFISHSYLTNHFKTLLNSKEKVEMPPKSTEPCQLDIEITLEELNESAKVSLPPGKGVGADNLNNEMIASLVEIHPQLVLKLFNNILNSGEIMPEWVISYIVPIYKTGPKSDPSNYRGCHCSHAWENSFSLF